MDTCFDSTRRLEHHVTLILLFNRTDRQHKAYAASSTFQISLRNRCMLPVRGFTSDRWQSKTILLSTNVTQGNLETEFSIAIAIENIVSSDL